LLRFDAWVQTIDSYSGNDFLYLNPKGIIPVVAVIRKGEKRTKPFQDKRRFDATGIDKSANADTLEEEEDDITIDKAGLADMDG
jgi:tRNA pseudouridine38-40 synthase